MFVIGFTTTKKYENNIGILRKKLVGCHIRAPIIKIIKRKRTLDTMKLFENAIGSHQKHEVVSV